MDDPDVLASPTRLGLVLCSDPQRPLPSTRIALLNVLPALHDAGFETTVLLAPPQPNEMPSLDGVVERAIRSGCRAVVFQKVHGTAAERAAREMRAHGIATLFMVCDVVDAGMVDATDATIIVTDFLRSLHPPALRSRIHVVHDGIEREDAFATRRHDDRGSRRRPLRAVLVTSAALDHLPQIDSVPPWLEVRVVGRYATGLRFWREAAWRWRAADAAGRRRLLRLLLHPRIRCISWSEDRALRELSAADLAIIPIDDREAGTSSGPPSWQVKSENRLTMKMAMALPVVATPIPSYESLVTDGHDALFARGPAQWAARLAELRDPARRRAVGEAARARVLPAYSKAAQAEKLIAVLRDTMAAVRRR